jgi:hypothetical protein
MMGIGRDQYQLIYLLCFAGKGIGATKNSGWFAASWPFLRGLLLVKPVASIGIEKVELTQLFMFVPFTFLCCKPSVPPQVGRDDASIMLNDGFSFRK